MEPRQGEQRARNAVAVLLSPDELVASKLTGALLDGFDIRQVATKHGVEPDLDNLDWASIVVMEIDGKNSSQWETLDRAIRKLSPTPVIVALRDPTHGETRQCLHSGAVDVIALPLEAAELTEALSRAHQHLPTAALAENRHGKVIAFVKSVGGVGATALAAQMGCLLAERDKASGQETCLVDMDIQFGSAALYMGMAPALTIADLIAAGDRTDGALFRSITARHKSGLYLVAAPPDILPLESVNADQMSEIIDLAIREFAHVIVDLPGSWTNWSLSLVARADAICLVTEMNIPSLRQARRQLNMLASQGLDNLPIHIVVNRYERGFMKMIRLDEAEQALDREVSCTISNDFKTLSSAIDQGVPVGEIRSNSRLERDMSSMIDTLMNHIEQRE